MDVLVMHNYASTYIQIAPSKIYNLNK